MRRKNARVNRVSQIIRFFRVSRLLLWTIWVIYRERKRVIRARERGNYDVQPNIEVLIQVLVAFRKAAIELGVLMIKLGQFLSSRADLLPEQALKVLSSLQDEVPEEPFDHVIEVIETELGKSADEVFSFIERKCTAAASLGQVHKATLVSTGETVAVKIQRPNIEQLVAMDLSTIKFVIRIINRFVDVSEFIDLMAIYREFRRTTYEEIDFVREAANSKRFKEMFKDDTSIYIPRIHDEYVTKRLLVMEWIDGIKVNDYAALEANHISRIEVAKRTVQAYFQQFFVEGFFHADPHPGNIFVKSGVTTDDGGPVIAFLDFGMVGTLNRSMKKALKDLFLGFLARDSRGLVKAMERLGFIGDGANRTSIEHGMGLMMEQYYGMTLGEARDMDIPEVGQDIENLLYGQPFQIPAQFAFTGRAIGTLVGVSTGLAPEFNFVEVALPYARKFLGLDAENIGQTIQQTLAQLLDVGRVLLTLPRSLEQVVSKIDSGQIEVRVAETSQRGRGRHGRRRNGNNGNSAVANGGSGSLTWAFMFAVAVAAGVFLMTTAHLMLPGWLCLGFAGVMVLGLLVRR